MASRYESKVYELLFRKPVMPNEVALKPDVSHRTALRALMHLALTKEDVRYKSSGKIHLFWKGS